MILVTGANGVVGTPLCEALKNNGASFLKVSRSKRNSDESVVQWDLTRSLEQEQKKLLSTVDTLIHCAPIWLLPQHLTVFAECGVRRMVVFSSTSVISKTKSLNIQEQHLVEQLSTSEKKLRSFCERHGIDSTILRPSMIYGYARDQNVMKIAKFINKFGFMLLVGEAKGLRQPIHASDLVNCAITILEVKTTYGKTYNLAGGEELTYREMVERIFFGLNMKVRIISLPLSLFRIALNIAAKVTKFSFTPEMADRMNQNLVYDNSIANNDFSFEPEKFLTSPVRDLHF